MSSSFTEKQLIDAAKRRDMVAVRAIFDRHASKIYRYIALCIPTEDIEEVTADIFTELIRSLPNFADINVPLETWLYRIGAAQVAEYYRRKGMWRADVFEDTDNNVVESEEQKHLREAISELSEDDQQILMLYFVEKQSETAISKILGKSARSVQVAQYRALQNLTRLLEPEPNDEPRFFQSAADEVSE